MRIFAISDLHLSTTTAKPMDIFGPVWENYLGTIEESIKDMGVTDDDVVLIAGDISWAMKLEEAIPDLEYISTLPGKKIIIRGNHDYWWKGIGAVRGILPKGMYAIQNDAIKIGDTIFCGTRGWTVPEHSHKTPDDEKIFNREIQRLELSLKDAVRQKTDNEEIVAMMHYPPFDILRHDSPFTDLFEKYGVKKVVFGHLHSYDKKQNLISEKNGVTYYLTSCDLVGNKIVEVL